jgi:dTDP-4-dehydrorhamnose 3,5-epimerase
MNIVETAIPAVKIITPRQFGDDRGFFSEVFSARDFSAIDPSSGFVQDNHSWSAKSGTVRGLHFQTPPFAQGKLVRVTRGRILDIAVDIRKSSPTFGRHVAVELSAENWSQLWIPPGFAHGFSTLEDNCEVLYKVTAFYAKDCDYGLASASTGRSVEAAPYSLKRTRVTRRLPDSRRSSTDRAMR